MSEVDEEQMYLDISGEWRPRNPKMIGSGMIACRPQAGPCPGRCVECYYSGGRYYEDISVPHVPDPEWVNGRGELVRMNDGNDSNHLPSLVERLALMYKRVYLNTRIPVFRPLMPTILTVNGDNTDKYAWLLPKDWCWAVMAVRVRVNTWNLDLVKRVIEHYRKLEIPVCLTYMAYYTSAPEFKRGYEMRKRALNPYYCIRYEWRERIEEEVGVDQDIVYTCTRGRSSLCKDCMGCMASYKRWEERQ